MTNSTNQHFYVNEKLTLLNITKKKLIPALRFILLAIAAAALLFSASFGQGFEKNYGGTGNEYSYAIESLNDGGYVMAGSTNTYGYGGNDVYIVRTNSSGKMLWSRVVGGPGDDVAFSITRGTGDDIIVAGQTNSFGAGGYDIYLIKLGKNGDTKWTKTIGGAGNEFAKGIVNSSNTYYIAGGTTSSGAGGSDMYFVKTDTAGNVITTKTIGFAGDEYANSIDKTYNGNFVMAGRTNSFGTNYVIVAKTTANGDTIWTRNYNAGTFTNSSTNSLIMAHSIRELNDHSYIITGFGHNASNYGNMFHAKISSTGSTTYFTLSTLLADAGMSVTKSYDGGYIIADSYCNYGCRMRMIKYNSAGVQQWQKDFQYGSGLTYNTYSNPRGIKELSNKKIITTGDAYWPTGGPDFLLVKTDSLGISNPYTAPAITAGGPTSFCAGGNVTLTAPSGYLTYQWVKVVGNGATYIANSTSALTVTVSGSYYCVMTNNSGIFVSTAINVTVTAPPSVSITNSGSPLQHCAAAGQSTQLNATSGYISYQWNLNGSPIAGATTTSYIPAASGSYTVTVTNSCGTTTTAASVVNTALVPSSNILCTGWCDITDCGGAQGNLYVNDYGAPTIYEWFVNGSTFGPSQTYSLFPSSPGNYTCKITNACGTSTSGIFTVNYWPSGPYFITPLGPTSGCGVASVLLESPWSDWNSYQWFLDGVLIPGAISQQYTAGQSGNYTVIFETFNCGFELTDPIGVGISTSPAPVISAGGATQVCAGTVSLSANTSGTGVTYQWQNNNVNIGGATSQTYVAPASGSYRCNVFNPQCGTAPSNLIDVVIGSPTGTISLAQSAICNGNSTTATFATTRPGYNYQWKLNGSNIAGATASTYSANAAGSYTCAVTNSCGTFTSNSAILTVNSLPVATATAAGSTILCPSATVMLNANSGTGLTYAWMRNSSYLSGATAQSYNAASVGNYRVRVTNASGCTALSTPDIIVTSEILPVAAAKALEYPVVCSNSTIGIKTPHVAGYTYQWKKNNVNIAGATDSIYNAPSAGTYTVVTTNICGSSTSQAVVLTGISSPSATITALGPTTFCAGGNVVLKAVTTSQNVVYKWKRNGSLISSANDSVYTATTAGNYNVQIWSAYGCSKTSYPTVVTVPCRTASQEVSDTPEYYSSQADIFPNPAKGVFTVFFSEKTKQMVSVILTDVLGKTVGCYTTVENFIEINRSDLNKGVYYVTINATKFPVVKKLVIN